MPTGVAYSDAFLRHDPGPRHPEAADRLTAITARLRSTGVWDLVTTWEPGECAESTLELVHTPRHVAAIRMLTGRGGGRIDADTFASAASWEAALRAAGAVVEAAERVHEGRLDNALCLVRPPGHHATPDQAMGFCLFNNVAIAAASLLASGRAQRVAILDYDVHHGNGTQDAFFERGDVLYVSTHQYPLYPGTGHWREVGSGPGAGCTVNVSLPPNSGDAVFAAAGKQVVEPAVRRYAPDFILLSLGFDGFWDDPLASLRLSIGGGFVPLIRSALDLAAEVCGGRLVVALEGGYHRQALAAGIEAVCRLLLRQEPTTDTLGPSPTQLRSVEVQPLLDAIRHIHRLD